MIEVKEFRNYRRTYIHQNGGIRTIYFSTLTNRIFCDGFVLGSVRRRSMREGERIFKLGSIDPNIENAVKFVSNEKS